MASKEISPGSLDHSSTGAIDARADLECQLRRKIKQAEEPSSGTSSHASASRVVCAVENFLTAWETLQDDDGISEQDRHELPYDFIRQKMCQAQKVMVPGHEDLQRPILSMLRTLQSTECRSLIIEFVPLVLPKKLEESTIGNVMRVGRRNIKKELMSALKDILHDDTTLLKHVLDTLAMMAAASIIPPKDVFQFSLGILPKTPENDLHIVVEALFQYAENGSDVQDSVDAIRTELSLLEKTDVSDMFSIVAAFDAAFQDNKNPVVLEQYIARCEEIVEEACHRMQQSSGGRESNATDDTLSVFDLTVLLLAKEKDVYLERVATIIHGSIAKESNIFLDLCPHKVVQLLLKQTDSDILSPLQERLFDSYMDTCLTTFLSYCHFAKGDEDLSISKAAEYMKRVIVAVPKTFQERLVGRLLSLFEGAMNQCQKEGSFSKQEPMSFQGESKVGPATVHVCRETMSIAVEVANEDFGVLVPSLPHFVGFLESDGIHSPKQDKYIVEKLCEVTAALFLNDGKDDSDERLILLCRKLLLSHPEPRTKINRQLRGLELINAITTAGNVTPAQLSMAGRLVTRLLGATWLFSNHCIGVEAIKIARYLHLKKGIMINGKDVIGRILSKERMTQYPQKISTFTGYGEVPKFLELPDGTPRPQKFRAMICSFESFLSSDASLMRPSTWKQSTIWLYTLLEAFLAVGRPAKWIPHAWTEAGIEFPPVPETIVRVSDKKNRLNAWIEDSLGKFDRQLPHLDQKVGEIFEELFQSCPRASDRKEVMHFSYRFTISLMLGLSVAAAVLNNVHDYFKQALAGGTYEERREPTMLIQHQLIKLYDLQRHILSMRDFFLTVSKKKRRRGRPSASNKGLPIEKNEAAEQIDRVVRDFFSSDVLVDSGAVWVGLTNPSHDSLIVSSVDSQIIKEDLTDSKMASVLHMRLYMLSHLTSLLKAGLPPEKFSSDTTEFRQRMAQFLRMALYLSLCIQSLNNKRKKTYLLDLLDEVSQGYFRLLHLVLISASRASNDSTAAKHDDFIFFFNLYSSLVGSKDPMKDAIHQDPATDLMSMEVFNSLAMSVFDRLQQCSAAATSQLLETLSVFAIVTSRYNSESLYTMIDLHWESTKLNFPGSGTLFIDEVPFALDVYMRRFAPNRLQTGFLPSPEEQCLKETLSRMVPTATDSGGGHTFLAHVMCRHWSLVALSQKKSELLVNHLTKFLTDLQGYLEDKDKPKEISVPVAINAAETATHDQTNVAANPTTPTNRNLVTSESFPSLNADTCSLYFDSLLKLTVASIGIFSITEEAQACQLSNSWALHPFAVLENYFEVCGSLLDMLKEDFGFIFWDTIPPSVIQTLKLLLDVSMEKIELCIEWRNTESFSSSEEMLDGDHDPLAKNLLKDLIEAFCVEIVNALQIVCDEKKRDPRIVSVNRKAEKILDRIQHACLEFDLGDVKTHYSDASHSNAEQNAKRRKLNGPRPQQQFDASTIEEHQQEDIDEEGDGDSGVARDDNEASWDGDGDSADDSSASGAFGVSGNWGQGHKHDNSSDDDDSSRQLGEITVTH